MEYSGSASSSASFRTKYDFIVTGSATSTASSDISALDAENIAQNLASSIAANVAENNANIINESIDIVNSKFIQPLDQFQNSVISTNNVRLDQVIASLDAFKTAIYNVNYVSNLINTNSEQIVTADQYASVLEPIVEKEYLDDENYFWILDLNEPKNNYIQYFNWKKFNFWSGLNYNEVVKYNNNNNLQNYNDLLARQQIYNVNVFKKLINQYPSNKFYYLFNILDWDNGLKIYIQECIQDVLVPDKWITISSGVDLINYLPNTNDLSNFSQEYLNFVNDLSNEIAILNGSDWVTDAIWPYIFPANLSDATCLYSSLYPEWTGLNISECFIPGSDIDYPAIITNIINDLYFNYPPLLPGQIAISTYNIGSTYYVSLIKIDTYNGVPCFKEKRIAINPYFSQQLNIVNDTTINGSLKVQTYDGQPIIETDNISKITSFHDKIGVNQDTYNVKGLVDIDNVSFTFINNILNQFIDPLLYSNNVFNDISSTIVYGQTSITNVPVSFQQNVFVFKTMVQNIIQESDISFLFVPYESQVFATKTLSSDSFTKIQTIVNELNKMLPQINLNQETQTYNFSFIELLNDTKNSYLCSLRGKLVRNPANPNEIEIYFITSFLNVNSVVIHKSYTKDFNNIVNQLSSCSRLTNFSVLLVKDPNIYNALLEGNSIGSTNPYNPYFSDVINNSPYFRERFGNQALYVFCTEFINKEQISNNVETFSLFNEYWPYFAGKKTSELFLPNNGRNVEEIDHYKFEQYINKYGTNQNISFLVHFPLLKGPKISVSNIITINGKQYFIGCGFNVSDIISESIVLKGDNTITGNLSVIDSDTNNTIFNVDTYNKQSFSLYKLGLGTNNPQSKLDIRNGGVGDIIQSIDKLASNINDFNINIQLLKNANSEDEFENIITTQFKHYDAINFTETHFVQINDNYYVVEKIPDSLTGLDTEYIYHWLYPNWKNQKNINIVSPQYQTAIKNAILMIDNIYNKSNIFNNSNSFHLYDWSFGKKCSICQIFEINNQKYSLINGINLEILGIDINDDNVISFYQSIIAYTYYIQDIQIRLNNITNIPNEQKATDYRNQQLNIYPIQNAVQYTINYLDISNMTISKFDYNTLQTSDTQVYNDITDVNLLSKMALFYNNTAINYYYFYVGCIYSVSFEDKYNDFVSVFLCTSADNENYIYTFISLELQINTIIKSSISLVGDMTIKGDTYFSDVNDKNFVFIDSENKFFGINSLDILNKYNTLVTNIDYSNLNFSKQSAVISSNLYPNLVTERIATGEQKIDMSPEKIFFVPLAPITMRRTSNYYSYQEMYDYSQQYTTPVPIGFYAINGLSTTEKPLENRNIYGSATSYEIKDYKGFTNIVGRSFMGIDKITNEEIRGGFGVQVVDDDNTSIYRNILYVNNDSQLQVNSVSLAGNILSVDSDNNLLFNGKKVMLSD
jgi:hypothetical protein